MKRRFLFDRRAVLNFDWFLLVMAVALCLVGVVTIYSATRPLSAGSPQPRFYVKQLYWIVVGLIVMTAVLAIHYRRAYRYAYVLYGAGLVLLSAVLFVGRTGMGAQRWISLGPLSIQPSEIAKLLLVVALARHLSDRRPPLGLRDLLRAFFLFLLPPLALLLKQPDLGTGLMFTFVFCAMILAAGVRPRVTVAVLLIGLISVPILGEILFEHLKPYQQNRITAFIEPEADPTGIGYQIIQSKIAVGSGGLTGKGLLHGTQAPLSFLPERHTDFIFSIFAEEWGFLGCVVVLGLYLLLILRMLDASRRARDDFGYFLAFGLSMMVFFYLFVNISMTLGMLPVVGVPLPFMSYGGTALVSNFVIIAAVMNIRMRRYELFY